MNEWESTKARLRVGMIILTGGERYRVDLVNYSRARCMPLEKRSITIVDKVMLKERTFEKFGGAINISPNSDCLILGMITDDQFKKFAPKSKAALAAKRQETADLKDGTPVMVTIRGQLTKGTFREWSKKYPGYATVEVGRRRSPRKIREILTEKKTATKPKQKQKRKGK
jgi:hypothetical protein